MRRLSIKISKTHLVLLKAFVEVEHPRDECGRFTSGGSVSSTPELTAIKETVKLLFQKDGKDEDEIIVLLSLVLDATKDGEVVRTNERNIEVQKNGIVAILRKENEERNSKWLLTGVDDWDNEEVVTDAIKMVIANNNYAPEYSSFRTQVEAIIASLVESMPESERKSKTKKINKSATRKYFIQAKKPVVDDTIKRLKKFYA